MLLSKIYYSDGKPSFSIVIGQFLRVRENIHNLSLAEQEILYSRMLIKYYQMMNIFYDINADSYVRYYKDRSSFQDRIEWYANFNSFNREINALLYPQFRKLFSRYFAKYFWSTTSWTITFTISFIFGACIGTCIGIFLPFWIGMPIGFACLTFGGYQTMACVYYFFTNS